MFHAVSRYPPPRGKNKTFFTPCWHFFPAVDPKRSCVSLGCIGDPFGWYGATSAEKQFQSTAPPQSTVTSMTWSYCNEGYLIYPSTDA